MNVKYYILNGVSASGKDTFVEYCNFVSYHVGISHFSSVMWVKNIAEYAGWDKEKDEKGRNLLSGLKHLLTEYNDLPFKNTTKCIEEYAKSLNPPLFDWITNCLIFIDVREPEEIERYKKYFNAKTVLIRNPSAEAKVFNESDLDVLDYNYDIVVWNDSTKEHLKELAKEFVKNETDS